MGVDNGLAAIQFFIDRRKRGIAQILVAVQRLSAPIREHVDAVGVELVEAIFDFFEAPVDIRQGQHREMAEAAGII